MKKRRRLVVLLLLPAVIFMWIVGWSLYWIGGKKEVGKGSRCTGSNSDETVRSTHASSASPKTLQVSRNE